MITGEIKSKGDAIWNTMWSRGNPLSVIEHLTYLLFIKRLDELQTLKESKAARTDKAIDEPLFNAGQEHLHWSRFNTIAGAPAWCLGPPYLCVEMQSRVSVRSRRPRHLQQVN